MSHAVTPFSLKDAPALIERLLPVQKLSAEAYKEQMAVQRQDAHRARQLLEGPQAAHPQQGLHPWLSAAGHRRPGARPRDLREAHGDGRRIVRRPLEAPTQAKEILATLSIARIERLLHVEPAGVLPAPRRWTGRSRIRAVKVAWRTTSPNWSAAGWRRRCSRSALPRAGGQAQRPEEVWTTFTTTSGMRSTPTSARAHSRSRSWSSSSASCALATARAWLTRSAALARFRSRRPGSAAMSMPPTLTRSPACSPGVPSTSSVALGGRARRAGAGPAANWSQRVQAEIDQLGVETDGNGWRAKVFLYCVEATLPADRLDGSAACRPGCEQGLPGRCANWCRTPSTSGTTSTSARSVSDEELAAAADGHSALGWQRSGSRT